MTGMLKHFNASFDKIISFGYVKTTLAAICVYKTTKHLVEVTATPTHSISGR